MSAQSATQFPITFDENPNYTATYAECIEFHRSLAEAYPEYTLREIGYSDAGKPIHLGIVDRDRDFDPLKSREKGKMVFLINNAIHAGEPCGVEASMLLLRDLMEGKLEIDLSEVVILVIPMYNIGGVLHRNSTTRANQKGPEAHGFRGNARNLDLNRDFVKCDSKNAEAFNKMFAKWQPEVFFDNHTSNGADYQYTMTLIATQKDKLADPLRQFQQDVMLPALYQGMRESDWEMTPYVNVRTTPDDGIIGFMDYARYSSGYAALFQCLSFMPETHMLKPYEDRVLSTRSLLEHALRFSALHADRIISTRAEALQEIRTKKTFQLDWKLDTSREEKLLFKGYDAKFIKSLVGDYDRLAYDHSAPYEKEIPYWHTYQPSVEVKAPAYYVLPQAYTAVIKRLQWNGVAMNRLPTDTILDVEMYRIRDFKDRDRYEGHYMHYDVELEKIKTQWEYRKGDWLIPLDQNQNEYIVQTLEPQAPDSYFAWNFFDGILMQKEYFSSYVFEDRAVEILKDHPEIKKELEAKKASDPDFVGDQRAILNFIYTRSDHYEKTHRLYPVGRVF